MPILARRRRATSRARCEALMSYSLLHVLHLLGAIAFIGTLFFEVIILAKVKPQLAPGAVLELEQALGKRSRTVLHWVVLLVYGAGLGLVAMLLRSGRMTPNLYRKLHWTVLAQMLGIVLLAKGMFYIQW